MRRRRAEACSEGEAMAYSWCCCSRSENSLTRSARDAWSEKQAQAKRSSGQTYMCMVKVRLGSVGERKEACEGMQGVQVLCKSVWSLF